MEKSGAYADPISFRVEGVNKEGSNDPRRPKWAAHAEEQWGGRVDEILGDHGRVASAASEADVVPELLKALALALAGTFDKKTRDAWTRAVRAAARKWGKNKYVGPLARYVLEALQAKTT
jgi:hypothetical protein